MQPVTSAAIAAIGYHAATRVLRVRFHSNPKKNYDFPDISPQEHEAFVRAGSIGAHYQAHVKGRAAPRAA